jgi:homoserine kinase
MAVDIWNDVTVTRADKFLITVEGDSAEAVPTDEGNLVCAGVKAAFKAAGIDEVPPLHYHLTQRIPFARGLGSSSAAIVAGLLAGLTLLGHKLDITGKEELLQLATEIEGHPDNVAPAIYGGIQLGLFSERENRWMTTRVPVPHGLIFVLFVPPVGRKSNTKELRKCVPTHIPMGDAVFNMGRLAWLVTCLLTNNTTDMREGFEDRLHQHQRGEAVYGHLYPMIDAAYEAGARGVYLSGAGPSVMAICTGGHGDFFVQKDESLRKDHAVADALMATADRIGIEGAVFIAHPTNCGGVVVATDPPYSTDLVKYASVLSGDQSLWIGNVSVRAGQQPQGHKQDQASV